MYMHLKIINIPHELICQNCRNQCATAGAETVYVLPTVTETRKLLAVSSTTNAV